MDQLIYEGSCIDCENYRVGFTGIAGECALGVSTDGEHQIIWPDDKACGAFEVVKGETI